MNRQSRDGTVLTTVRLPERTHKWAKEQADQQRKSMTLLIAEILDQAANKPRQRKQPA